MRRIREYSLPRGIDQIVDVRVIEIPASEPLPQGAEEVPADTPLQDWRPQEK